MHISLSHLLDSGAPLVPGYAHCLPELIKIENVLFVFAKCLIQALFLVLKDLISVQPTARTTNY